MTMQSAGFPHHGLYHPGDSPFPGSLGLILLYRTINPSVLCRALLSSPDRAEPQIWRAIGCMPRRKAYYGTHQGSSCVRTTVLATNPVLQIMVSMMIHTVRTSVWNVSWHHAYANDEGLKTQSGFSKSSTLEKGYDLEQLHKEQTFNF